MTIKRKILSFLIVLSMIFSLIPTMAISSFAYTDVSSTLPVTFVKTGRVVTLVKDYSDYYIMRETFAADGSYVENVIMQSITKAQYDSELAKKEYDVLKTSELTSSIGNKLINSGGGRLYFVNMVNTPDGKSTQSFIASLGNGYNNSVSLSNLQKEFNNPHSFLLNNNGRYFRGTTNTVTGITTLVPLQQDTFSLLKLTMGAEDISYLREIKYSNDSEGKAHFSDIVYGQSDVEIISFVTDAVEINTTIKDINDGKDFVDESEASNGEAADGFDSNRYGDKYTEWSDEFNNGYVGTWQDPSYLGNMQIVEWEDPFWKNSDINIGNTVSVGGYYDDMGNWVSTDVNGNPIPSVPGKFDSAGNFMPEGLNGYYDPEGVYHPLFNIDEDISVNNGNIYIDEKGYFDRYGTWHEKTKGLGYIYLYDGSMISPEGIYYDVDNSVKDILVSDMWGTYMFGSWMIYSDGTIFDTSLNKIILNNGTEYYATLTEGGNFFFEDGTEIMKNTFSKGIKKGENVVQLSNGSLIYESDIIEYGNGIVYNSGSVILPSKETINSKFVDGLIDLGQYGKIYANGHYSEYNDFGNLITDDDRVIINDTDVILPNGYIWNVSGHIYPAYLDGDLNIVCIDGTVYSRTLKKGAYTIGGEFIENASPEIAYFDRIGNQISNDGTVQHEDKIGYYDETGTFFEGVSIYDNGYYTCDGHWINNDGSIRRAESAFGYTDTDGYYVLYNGLGKFSKDGVYYKNPEHAGFHINENGNLVSSKSSDFAIKMDGTISLIGESSAYYGNGLFKIKKSIGYYDDLGRFIISKTNPYIESLNGFYDSNQKFHNESEIYIDSNGNWKLLYNPNLGLQIKDGMIGFAYSSAVFSSDGLTTIDGKTGYYNSEGKFIESNKNSYLGGFYNNVGTWIDKTYYQDFFGNIGINNGNYIYTGNYITPSGDIGYFDENGEFILNKMNPYENGFYDVSGNFHKNTFVYRDYLGFYKSFGEKFIMSPDGAVMDMSESKVKIGDYTLIYFGIFKDENDNLGTFNKNGEFQLTKNNYLNGTYLPNGGFVDSQKDSTIVGNMTYFGKTHVLVEKDDGTYLLYFYDGYAIDLILDNGYYVTTNGLYFSNDIKYCMNYNGELLPFESEFVKNGFWFNNSYYLDPSDNMGYFEKDGTFYLYSGGYGHYDNTGVFVENLTCPYINGFYNHVGNWISNEAVPNKGYFNKYGMPRNGYSNNLDGFFDNEGTLHVSGQDIFIDINGNAHLIDANAIGFKDLNDNIHLYNDDGYFNVDGTYIVDNTIMGYYNKDGELKSGKNPSLEGFYDMYKNWHQFGDTGYFDENGKYYEQVNGEIVGFYNAVGEFTEGWNPYLNGFYGFNGEWNNLSENPLTLYYDLLGEKHVGTSPYYNGFYDMNGSWYFSGEKGFYDKNGTFYNILTQEIGYYDKLGIYFEGTNPYQHGYYDPDKNLHLFGQAGYYNTSGTYIDIYGKNYYYLSGGIRREGINPNTDGFFDVRGNWHEFNGDGYYAPDGSYHEYLMIVSSFKVGSPDYILFEGTFTNTEYVSPQIKNTVQFSIFKDGMNTRYLDTGIRVAANAMISYDKATDILHAISIYNDGTFIEDNQSCMLIYKGSIINLLHTGKISVKELKDKFIDADIEIVVARSRIGEKYALAEAIETKKDIKVFNDGERINLNNPMVVQNGIPYVAINDFKNIMKYNIKATSTDDGILLVFTLKDNVLKDSGKWANSISSIVGSFNLTLTYGPNVYTTVTEKPFINVKLENATNSTLYMPASLIGALTGKNVELDTLSYELLITTKASDSPIKDN